ncbi:1-hydroxycarotenoid 3,4-desaturase CrtD [Actibacterium sp. 188UL27-1]|uniref:1-hydroxycarotenoid 3,4-desaturase CrtD n=1 Tax=Actibacterium sp. 188UL27-1 TaxID=2786961 RepID=UPI00195DCA19|nr:1-hydroxycarotenoid 3,4-desaturase CrtD [Actibacterium sp. 188UL27-1]MBM7070020.1 phytoene desaturase [Actibacterium sp. 188UL27-1]
MADKNEPVVIIGAGLGGLATALRLAHAGLSVTVLERAGAPGGKMRTLPSAAGPVDAGPTVLTMRHVFDQLFADVGETLDSHVTLEAETLLARHFWRDGSTLDLHADPDQSAQAMRDFGGPDAEQDYRRFAARAKRLYDGFKAPMMETAAPSQLALTAHVLRHPALIPDMAPHRTLMSSLRAQFRDPRLAQLFGRYATYVGGSPYKSPAILSLIAHAEAAGVWRVKGGMHRLAQAMADLATAKGATFHYDTHIHRIEVRGGSATAVIDAQGTRHPAKHIVFNGDPAALIQGLLGEAPRHAVKDTHTTPRSLSAYVWAFASTPKGPDLAYHNVFFGADPRTEFDPLHHGQPPVDPTLYICAEDRGGGHRPTGLERFEIIMNGPPVPAHGDSDKEPAPCQTPILTTLNHFGLTFNPTPNPATLTTPRGFQTLFPGSAGSLYGRSPHGMMAAFHRPTARTALPGLILAGGGTHPGAGIPMATLSGKHAAETILTDRALTSPSRPTAMPGGMSTGSATMPGARSPSSVS